MPPGCCTPQAGTSQPRPAWPSCCTPVTTPPPPALPWAAATWPTGQASGWSFAAGAAAYLAGYLIFAPGPHAPWLLLAGFLLAGTGIVCAETSESTLVARQLPERLRGNGFGVLGLVQAAGDLASSAIAGLLWAAVSPETGFAYAASWIAAALLAAAFSGRQARTALTRPDPKHHPRAASLMSPGSSRQMDEMLLHSGRVQAHRTGTAAYLNSAYSWAASRSR